MLSGNFEMTLRQNYIKRKETVRHVVRKIPKVFIYFQHKFQLLMLNFKDTAREILEASGS
ncbi:hypothetical protein CS542_10655 [Pedobacter sp. IW39]|nr:hypothetical protein CS542_10655 [Pedobacter sp. IW39]